MAELSNDIPKKLWEKILFTDVIKPIFCYMNKNLSYIYVDPTNTHSEYVWLLLDGRLVQTGWVYIEKDVPYRPKQLIYVGEGFFHHRQQRKT